jgi:NitT/TauT family transport system permease protein
MHRLRYGQLSSHAGGDQLAAQPRLLLPHHPEYLLLRDVADTYTPVRRYTGNLPMELTQFIPERNKAADGGALRQPLSPAQLQPLVVPISIGLLLLAWSILAQLYPAWILPGPMLVAQRFMKALSDGTLVRHAQVTITEALAGFALGLIVASVTGYVLAKSPTLERLVAPYIVASQSTPVVAVAPLLILWFGAGILAKVLVCALVVFFPILVNTVVGLRSIDREYRLLFRSLDATAWQTFTKLELPAALPILFGGFRVGITLSVVGAVVGEFLGSDRGLGALINIARGLFDTPLMFVALLTLMTTALILYLSVVALERTIIRWR